MNIETPEQAPQEPWRATWLAFREAAGFEYADDRTPDDELDAQWIASWKAAAQAAIGEYAKILADVTEQRDRYDAALTRLANTDTWVLDQGLGGGFAEEHHVRASLAKQALGEKVECCTMCMVSLGLLDPDDAS